jgi:DNA modification methylase
MEFNPKLLVGDCRNVMNSDEIPTGSIDLIVTSPPYNCKIKYDSWDDERTYDEYLVFMEEWLRAAYHVLKDDGRIALNVPYEINQPARGGRVFLASDIWQIMKNIGFKWNGLAKLHEQTAERVKYTAWGSWMSASAPYIYCMDGNTPIITDCGLKPLRNISAGDRVLSHRGNYCKVFSVHNRIHDGDVIDITVSNNLAESIRCTSEHMFIGVDISPNYVEIAKDEINRIASIRKL